MSESDDPLEKARKAREADEKKKRDETSQQADECIGKLQKWGADLAAALDSAAGAIPSLGESSEHDVRIVGYGATLSYFRPGAKSGPKFELTIKARAICVDTSTPGIKGQIRVVSDPEVDHDGLGIAVLEAILQADDGGPVPGSYPYGLVPSSGYVTVDAVRFKMFLTTLAGR